MMVSSGVKTTKIPCGLSILDVLFCAVKQRFHIFSTDLAKMMIKSAENNSNLPTKKQDQD